MKKLFLLVAVSIATLLISCDDSDSSKKVSENSIVQACTIMNACDLNGVEINDCIVDVTYMSKLDSNSPVLLDEVGNLDLNAIISCLANSNSCDDAKECEKKYLGKERTTTECNEEDFVKSCDGTKRVSCNYDEVTGKSYIVKQDCAIKNNICVNEDGNTYCKDLVPAECTENFSKCEGNIEKECGIEDDYIYYDEKDCSLFNMECVESNGKADCMPKADAAVCSGFGAIRCDSSSLILCYFGKEISYDCKDMYGESFECLEINKDEIKYGCQLPELAIECETEATCSGDILKYCINGETKEFNCKDNGYSRCQLLTSEDEDSISTCVY